MSVYYHGSAGISPRRQNVKRSHGELTATNMHSIERQPDVQDAVEQDFTLHFRVTDTAEFLQKLLPVEKTTVANILQTMKKKVIYDSKSGRWRGFPAPNSEHKEESLYAPFNEIAEAIRLAAEKIKEESPSASEMGPTIWADYHTRSPKSHDKQAAQLRPDILFALKIVADLAGSNEFKVSIPFSMCSPS